MAWVGVRERQPRRALVRSERLGGWGRDSDGCGWVGQGCPRFCAMSKQASLPALRLGPRDACELINGLMQTRGRPDGVSSSSKSPPQP